MEEDRKLGINGDNLIKRWNVIYRFREGISISFYLTRPLFLFSLLLEYRCKYVFNTVDVQSGAIIVII